MNTNSTSKVLAATAVKSSNGNGKIATNAEFNDLTTPVKLDTQTQEKPEQKIPSLEDRIFKVQQLSELVDRREKLAAHLKKLTSYKFSSDNSHDILTIGDNRHNEWATSNSEVVNDVVEFLKTRLIAKIAEVDALIIF